MSSLPFHQTPEACRLLGVEHEVVGSGDREVGVQLLRTRALPGARTARVVRFGRNIAADALPEVTAALGALAGEGGVVRVSVEVYAEDPDHHAAVEAALAAAGFVPAEERRSYLHTLWMDLDDTIDELLMSIHRSARRNVRLPERKGYRVEPLGPGTSVDRLEELYGETFRATGAEPPEVDWAGWLALAEARPDRVRIVGIRPESEPDPDGFAVGISHGDVAEYHHAASTRDRTSGVPLLYAPLWELVRWAKEGGARAFDFGGVTLADPDAEDPLEGISDFKRFFCRDVVRVGGEWVRDADSVAGSAWRAVRWARDRLGGD
jgi:LmbE family N-acetylglucosaminyl deacetylase